MNQAHFLENTFSKNWGYVMSTLIYVGLMIAITVKDEWSRPTQVFMISFGLFVVLVGLIVRKVTRPNPDNLE